MISLLDVVGLDVWDIPNFSYVPNVAGILSERISAPSAFLWPLVVPLARISLTNSCSVQVERVIIPFCIPQNRLMAPAKAFDGMAAVTEGPDYSVPQHKFGLSHHLMNDQCIEWG
ncbi:MAG: hypothetical protein P4L90_29125 [Rhodopila sp.]|nr:hypothetical protein [Rhodopila sp.]